LAKLKNANSRQSTEKTKKSPKFTISISNGKASFIYSDSLLPLTARLGKPKTRRVSHVEPNSKGQWVAKIIGGPSLGPFVKRQDALDAEVAYLRKKHFS